MSVRITATERDALYEEIEARLSGIDEVWLAVAEEDWARAEAVGREFCDDLRVLLEDLGFGEGSGQALELATSPEVLRRVLTRVQARARVRRASEERERAEQRRAEERTEALLEACRRVLGELG